MDENLWEALTADLPLYTEQQLMDCRSQHHEILPGLFLTSFFGANKWAKIEHLGITHIVLCGREFDQLFESKSVQYLKIPIADTPQDGEAQILRDELDNVFSFVDTGLQGEGKVLVHCAAGGSRSASFVIGYVMRKCSLSLKDALAVVRGKRHIVHPNFGFLNVLREYEEKLRLSSEQKAKR
mmetsp:Transcript_63077/g.131110  ORF Transcript_63077/g.131110 Transcript_63077/m.131110 type:complete len:182 (-) Transcript_63077:512-1057(-)|eukprot:CAMPEP_0181347178 /NCGR_PEP_ID=MMETSP1101-20121128/33742_1 /TAXON_ID=46948 /ORGANISM="Rhodomonas abbreviata, Strain Caron Lab Isolate" /LENGTH=181 /DNA_ID=CAMNT_0023459379 /DNA_START=163 /DNA_END=708 /DNA_ORIENTATION=+